MPKIALIAVLFVLLTGCAGAPKFFTFEPGETEKVFHPPMPSPLVPISQEPVVMTPKISAKWNKEIEDGERLDYVIYGWEVQDWLTMGQYDIRKDYYIKTLLEIIKWYGHPDLQDKSEKEPVKEPTDE